MREETIILKSNFDGLILSMSMCIPSNPKGIIVFAHGMAEHSKRYFDVMYYFAQEGFVTIIHDHRGHGKSILKEEDYGYFYENGINGIVEDSVQVIRYVKKQYPDLPLVLFGHSMGSLVVRNVLKQYDNEIDALIVCGSPSKNPMAKSGLLLVKSLKKLRGSYHRSNFIHKLVFGSFSKQFSDSTSENAWICSDLDVVKAYDEDEKCGFIFTLNGFETLFQLMIRTYSKKGWRKEHLNLPIYFISGSDDPCIIEENKFYDAVNFLKEIGYRNISSKLYRRMRHELLNESNKEQVYQDINKWINQKIDFYHKNK